MCDALLELIHDQLEEGRILGKILGRQIHLKLQIKKKIEKGKTVEQIAEELEENIKDILPLYQRMPEGQKEVRSSRESKYIREEWKDDPLFEFVEREFGKWKQMGINDGKEELLKRQINKKLAKGKSVEQIADELEETVEAILPLYRKVLEGQTEKTK